MCPEVQTATYQAKGFNRARVFDSINGLGKTASGDYATQYGICYGYLVGMCAGTGLDISRYPKPNELDKPATKKTITDCLGEIFRIRSFIQSSAKFDPYDDTSEYPILD
jgi:hypothetical protein